MKSRELTHHRAALGFTPQPAVRWLSPASLARTALKVAAATVFADFGDKRELEGSFPADHLSLHTLPTPGQPAQPPVGSRGLPHPRELQSRGNNPDTGPEELWLDFTADLGDGFDATYTVAWLLAQEALAVNGRELPRGQVLVLGGDEVYPVASPAAYENRMAGPYRTAFPARPLPCPQNGPNQPENAQSGPNNKPPIMLALPGNHDWYDGLTSFIRVFTRQRAIGSWRTIQTRSYFAVRLTGRPPTPDLPGTPGWWLLGLDSQLGQYIDEPQLDYFYQNVTRQLQPGDAIILCVAAPFWVDAPATSPDAAGDHHNEFRQVHFFEQDYLRRRFNPETGLFEPTGAEVRLWLTGDLHHYSRYAEDLTGGPQPTATQLITCGLGGAYLSDARGLPGQLALPPHAATAHHSAGPQTKTAPGSRLFTKAPAGYPRPEDSHVLGARLANPLSSSWLPLRNPGFGASLGVLHVVAALTLWTVLSAFHGASYVDTLRDMARSTKLPGLAVLVLAIPLLLALVSLAARAMGQAAAGVVVFARGALYQLCALAVSAAVVIIIPWPGTWPDVVVVVLALALFHAGGWTLGSEAFALFILATPSGEVASWRMSGQSIEDHKGFLRLHLAADGTLTVYPLVVDTICRDWRFADNDDDGARLVPEAGPPAVELLEEPITIARKGTAP
ncbi:hypothetical protein ACPFL9_06840 [Paenarthrobacter sp. NyZ202]|uniref:hypothetical protein n=1 Tax=Paenarthrobacter sp. NyZ202 TaxID=3402689 RepID=UPI003CF25BF5